MVRYDVAGRTVVRRRAPPIVYKAVGMHNQGTQQITSLQNPLLKEVRKAVVRGSLTADGCAVAESFHLLEEALGSDREVRAVLAADSVRSTVEKRVRGLRRFSTFVVPDKLFDQIAATEHSQGVMTLVKPAKWTLESVFRGRSMVVILDGIQDPGNAGAIVRAAEAFGATGGIFVTGTVSPHNPKTLRASAGSIFRLPYVHGVDAEIVRATLEQRRLDVYAAMPRGGKLLPEVDLKRRFALVLGSEAHGVGDRLSAAALDLRIPTSGVESLNVSLAAGVILYEARRQRVM